MLARSGRWVEALARAVAVLGGLALVLAAAMTVVSILGRAGTRIGLRPVPGDFELVSAATAFAVCAFLPWCQLARAHAQVGILTDRLGRIANRVIDLVADLALLGVALLVTWRHWLGLLDKQRFGETTYILQYPLWWAYAACLVGLLAWIVVGLWCAGASAAALAGREGRDRRLDPGAAG